MKIDTDEFETIGLTVKDLMFYVTMKCNLRCKSCYVGNDWLDNDGTFSLDDAVSIIGHFGKDGIDRLTFIGGEPTLHPNITDIIIESHKYNVREKRMTTNGQGLNYFDLDKLNPDSLDHISLSLDGHTREINDTVRGANSYEKAIKTFKTLKDKGFNVFINYTVNSINIDHLADAVRFFNSQQIPEINFHLLSLTGNASKNNELYVEPKRWIDARNGLMSLDGLNNIRLRIPVMFLTKTEYENDFRQYKPFQERSYHCDEGHRILIFPNGKVYMSADLIGTGYHIADLVDGRFVLNKNINELTVHREKPELTDPSSFLRQERFDGFVPLSISYKFIKQY